MRPRKASLTLSAAALALSLAAAHQAWAEPSASATAHQMTIAQAEDAKPENPPPLDPQTLTNPDANRPVTPAEVAECMQSWTPQTGMSKEEYEKSCKSTLKYFPEKGD